LSGSDKMLIFIIRKKKNSIEHDRSGSCDKTKHFFLH